MKTNSKPRTILIIYTIILYSLWSLLELYLRTVIGIDEFTKEVYIKSALWLIPAILIHLNFSDHMFIKKEEMYLLNPKCWIFVPIMLLFTIYIIIGEYLSNGGLTIKDKKKYFAVFINSLMFLAIHFPVWIQSGTFISVFTSGGFITVLLLSCIFSFAFIKTKSIWISVFLHFWWDLLLFIF